MAVSPQNVGNGPAFLLRSPAIRATLGSPLRVLIKSSFDRAFRVPNAAARLSAARLFHLRIRRICNEGHRRTRATPEVAGARPSRGGGTQHHSDPRQRADPCRKCPAVAE